MSKKRVIPINFQIYGNGEVKSIDCAPNKSINVYKSQFADDKKYKNYVFGNEDQAFIDGETLCKEIPSGSNIVLYPNGLNTISIEICINEDTSTLCKIKTKLKLSSKVSDLKEKITKERWESKPNELDQNDIQIFYNDKSINDDEYIFSYKETDELTVKAKISVEIDETPLQFYFQFPDKKPREISIELNPNKTFSQINEMDEFESQDYSFYFNNEEISKKRKIKEFKEAQEKDTPIQLRINYYIQIKYEKSKSEPQELHRSFSSNQQIIEVIDELSNVVKERRKITYDNKELNEDLFLSKIKYKKDKPLIITILPIEYTFRLEDEDNRKFTIELSDDTTVHEVIEIIQKDKKIKNDLCLCTGSKSSQKVHRPDEKMANFRESEIITIKKLDPLYVIIFGNNRDEKRLPVDCTVNKLLKLNKKAYAQSMNDKQKIIVKNKDKIIKNDQLLSELPSNVITIELSDPFYPFRLENSSEPIEVSIPDGTNYEDAISIVKSEIGKLKKIDNKRIEFVLKNYNFDTKSSFGSNVPIDEEPIIVKIKDPSYLWFVKKSGNKEDKGTKEEFVFPIDFSIGDAIEKVEKDLNFKYSIKIFMLKNNSTVRIDDKDNVYEKYYNNKYSICVRKGPVEYTFTIGKNEIHKKFNLNDTIGQISNNLTYDDKKNSLNFKDEEDSDSYFELEDRLKFKYNKKTLKFNDTFDSINYNPYENETIQISLSPPKCTMYSLNHIEKIQCDKNNIDINDIEIPEKNFILYRNLQPVKTKNIKIDDNTTLDYFSYETKVDFKFSGDDEEIENYSIYLNDDITINELKALVSGHMSSFEDKNYGPNRICFKYKNKEINKEFLSDINYKEGTSIDVSIKKYQIMVKIKGEIRKIELDDDSMTVGDLKKQIGKKQRFVMKYRNKELKETQILKELHLSKEEFINVETIKTKVLSCKDKEYKLDGLDLENEKKLKKHFVNIFEIDVENSKFYYDDDEIGLKKFNELPKGARIEFETRVKSFNNFEDNKYNKVFKTNNSIADVRRYIYEKQGENKRPIRIKSGGKFLMNKTKLFQVNGEIKIEIIKEKNCKLKILEYHEDATDSNELIVSDYFDCETTGIELKSFIKNYFKIKYQFGLMFDNNKIDDNDIICEFGDEIYIVPSTEEENSENKVEFTIINDISKKSKNIKKEFSYNEDKKISDYIEKLHLDDDDDDDENGNNYVFFEKVKMLSKSEPIKFYEEENGIQKVYGFRYKEVEDDLYKTANCVVRKNKALLNVDEIFINDAARVDKDGPDAGQIAIKYSPMTIFELRKKVALKLGFKKEADVDLIALFIPVKNKRKMEFVLLSDEDDVADVLTDNSKYNIHYKIVKNSNSKTKK